MKKIISVLLTFALLLASLNATATTLISINSDKEQSVNIFIPTYSLDTMVDIHIEETTVFPGENTIEISAAADDTVYVWSENMEPVSYTLYEPSSGDGIIHLMENSINADGVENVTVEGTTLTINSAGSYIIEGSLVEGQIVVSDAVGKKDELEITFNNVTVTNSTTAPFNAANGKITIILAENSQNTFTYSGTKKYSSYTTEDAPKGAFYSRRDLTIEGEGILTVTDNYKNALVSGGDLEIKKGSSLNITAVNNAIKGDNGVEFTKKTGTVTAYSSEGDCIKSDSVDSDTGLMETDKGYVAIKGGSFNLTAVTGDGIQADNYIDISGGTININSGAEGLKANEVNIPLSVDDIPTGEYGNGKIIISDGTVVISSGEDGIKATEEVNISGGNITITAEGPDGYDGIQVGETEEIVTGNSTEKTIVVPGTITISGGNINILNVSDDAVTSNHDICITGGTISGKSQCDFLKAYNVLSVSDGIFDIESYNDAIQSGNGLTDTETNGEIVSSNYTLGNISISGGNFTIKTNGGYNTTLTDNSESCKAIKGVTDVVISGGVFNINSADDALHSNYNLTVTGGDFTIYTGDDGIHADYILTLGIENGDNSTHTIDIHHSYEGIEGSVIYVLSGTQYVYSTDDGLNAAGDYTEDGVQVASDTELLAWGGQWGGGPGGGMNDDTSPYGMAYVKGGNLYIEAYGDGFDSNGSAEMTGGVVIVNGPTSGGNGVFDIGDGNGNYFNHIGGTLIGAGTNSMTITINSSQGVVKSTSSGGTRPGGNWGGSSSSGSAGTPIKIVTDNGNIVVVPKVSWNYLYASTPDMTKNGRYTYSTVSGYTGGTQVLGRTLNNIFYGLIENVD